MPKRSGEGLGQEARATVAGGELGGGGDMQGTSEFCSPANLHLHNPRLLPELLGFKCGQLHDDGPPLRDFEKQG